MKILILDPYPKRPWRISKDTSGGYGTANRFGDGVVAKLLTRLTARGMDWPPLHSVYTAGVLRDQGHDVSYSRLASAENKPDLVLVTSSIVSHETELDAIRKLAARGVKVGAIGPFATNVPKPYLDAGAFVISGEPEFYFASHPLTPESAKSLDGIIPVHETMDIDDLPMPAWDLVVGTDAPKFGLLGGNDKMLPIVATRGCPYSCRNYCVYPLQQGQVVRARAPEKVVAEMAHWQDTLGATLFIFRDPVFSINRKHTVAMCAAIAASGRKFKFVVETHLNNVDAELAVKLKDAGMVMIKVGIESINPEAISETKRMSLTADAQRDKIRMLEKLGVRVTCFYILGMPGDTPARFKATMDYAKMLNTVFAQISVFTPYPGTPAYHQFEKKILVDKYENFTQYDLVFSHESFSPPDVRRLLSYAYRTYYARPQWFLKYLSSRFSRAGA